jgi:hypothetical protein
VCWGPYFSQKLLESENGSTLLLCNRISKKSYIGQDAHGVRLADSRSELGVEFGLWSSERPPKSALFHGIFWNCVLQKNGFNPKEILEFCGNANTHGRRSETCASWWGRIAAVELLKLIVGIWSIDAAKYGCQPPNGTMIG